MATMSLRPNPTIPTALTHAAQGPSISPALTPPEPPWLPAQPPDDMLLQEWKYEMRRVAQRILPNLYLGPFQASTNIHTLHDMGITHILCLRDESEARLIYPRFPTEFQYMTLDIAESGNLISIFPRCRAFIDEALASGGAILVHCGIATAPAIVMGYLMHKFAWEYQVALGYVQSKRYCVSPSAFENQLREYAAIAQAYKATHGIPIHSGDKRAWEGEVTRQQHAPRVRRRRTDEDDGMDTG